MRRGCSGRFAVVEVAQSYARPDLTAIAQPLMDDLRDHTLETVQLARLDGLEMSIWRSVSRRHPMKLVSAVGSRLGAHATGVGKVLLAGLDPAELERRLDDGELTRYTERTITTRKALRAALAEDPRARLRRGRRGIRHRLPLYRDAAARCERPDGGGTVGVRAHAALRPERCAPGPHGADGNRRRVGSRDRQRPLIAARDRVRTSVRVHGGDIHIALVNKRAVPAAGFNASERMQ